MPEIPRNLKNDQNTPKPKKKIPKQPQNLKINETPLKPKNY